MTVQIGLNIAGIRFTKRWLSCARFCATKRAKIFTESRSKPTPALALVLKMFLLLPSPPPLFGRSHRLGLPMVVCVECLPADKPWDVVSVTRRSSGVAPRACVRVYARVLVPPNLYTYMHS